MQGWGVGWACLSRHRVEGGAEVGAGQAWWGWIWEAARIIGLGG